MACPDKIRDASAPRHHPDDFQALGPVHDDEGRTNVQINIAGEAYELIAVAARRRGMMTEGRDEQSTIDP